MKIPGIKMLTDKKGRIKKVQQPAAQLAGSPLGYRQLIDQCIVK
jgi:hypothetical protein